MTEDVVPRAVGQISIDQPPQRVREWLEARFGLAEVLREHIGGMSPGCATSFRPPRRDDRRLGPPLGNAMA